MKKALVFYGGWDGHHPAEMSARLADMLKSCGFAVDRVEGTDCLADGDKLRTYDLIVPCVTMGQVPWAYVTNVCNAVAAGTGLAGCHGGMGDAFRDNTDWQFLTGGQFVAHPGGEDTTYTVRMLPSPITDGIADFEIRSEQYYLHVDPAVTPVAMTRVEPGFPAPDKAVDMPAAWTRKWGKGRVFYCSVGHTEAELDKYPAFAALIERGMLWTAGELA